MKTMEEMSYKSDNTIEDKDTGRKEYKKPFLAMHGSLAQITLHGSCLCDVAASSSCPGDPGGCDRGVPGYPW